MRFFGAVDLLGILKLAFLGKYTKKAPSRRNSRAVPCIRANKVHIRGKACQLSAFSVQYNLWHIINILRLFHQKSAKLDLFWRLHIPRHRAQVKGEKARIFLVFSGRGFNFKWSRGFSRTTANVTRLFIYRNSFKSARAGQKYRCNRAPF